MLAASLSPTVFVAFTAGLLSFVSPCVLPLVPGYLGAVSGLKPGVARSEQEQSLPAVLWPALTFCLSFTVIFVALGMFATGIGAPLAGNRDILNKIAGAFLIVFGALLISPARRSRSPGAGRDRRTADRSARRGGTRG